MDALSAHFLAMARNNKWANARLLGACQRLSSETFAARRTGFFPSLRATLNHILAVDRYYLASLEGTPSPYADVDIAHPKELAEAQGTEDDRLVRYCAGLTPPDHSRTVVTERGARGRFPERVDALLPHLFQHQIHHRGQAHAMLSDTDVLPPQLDEFFLAYDRDPAAAQINR
ncbi:MAG: DinB family protein [Pseudomonadota bacterium]